MTYCLNADVMASADNKTPTKTTTEQEAYDAMMADPTPKSEEATPTQGESALVQPRLVRLTWSPPAPPCEECRYHHTRAETPFGPFLLTWKGWKDYDSPGFDETPWGEIAYKGWRSVEEAQAWAESEMERRINECLANNPDRGPE